MMESKAEYLVAYVGTCSMHIGQKEACPGKRRIHGVAVGRGTGTTLGF